MIPADAYAVRARIARAVLGAAGATGAAAAGTRVADDEAAGGTAPGGAVLGAVVLRPHQREAVARLRAPLAELGGALLADATGLGKTYVALALAREAASPLVVAPAALRGMWRSAMETTGFAAPIVSIESLGRGRVPDVRPDLVVVDEAHHARNPATRRHRALATLCAAARVLLLSATPVHNRAGDLEALLGLFLGSRAHRLDGADLARCIVRRTAATGDALPRVLPPVPIDPGGSDAPLAALLALPPPVPAADAGDGGALVLLGLVRQWASSEGALRAALRRRLVAGTALLAALDSGALPARADLRRWIVGDDAVQLELPHLLGDANGAPLGGESGGDVRAAVEAHLAGVRTALETLDAYGGADARRAAALLSVRARHPGERIVAFTQSADTVRALFRELRASPRVAALTAGGAEVAGGRLARDDAVARFAPRANGRDEPRAAERIDLLVTTDLLSEGVNLQDASVAVHLDLPWTPARLEQRVGRLARLGAARDRVAVYMMRPPAAAAALLDMERRLRRKLGAAAHVAGIAGTIVPGALDGATSDAPASTVTGATAESPSIPAATETIRATLRRWLAPASREPDAGDAPVAACGAEPDTGDALVAACGAGTDFGEPLAAVCAAERDGWLALLEDGAAPRLLGALDGGGPSAEPACIAAVIAIADGATPLDADDPTGALALCSARRALERWIACAAAAEAVDLVRVASSRARRDVVRRIAKIAAGAPMHRRGALAPLVARARDVATSPCGIGAERVLGALAAAPMPDEAWLRALGAFGELHARRGAGRGPAETRVAALLVLVRGGPATSPIAP
ncbi:MAG TPA: DEAD/DEAH box helicase [Gemmatimonadaceae bacterium]